MGNIIARHIDPETGRWVEIIRDFDNPDNPIRDWEWHGTVSLTPRYRGYGNDDRHNPCHEKFQKYLRAVRIFGGVAIPVYCYEHNSIAFSAGSFQDFGDSGVAGFAWVPPEKVQEHFKRNKEEATKHLEQMISTMDAYAQGECYGYVLYDADGSEVGSNYGFWNLGHRWQELMDTMADSVPKEYASLIRDCWYGEFDDLEEMTAGVCFAPAV